jgi:glycosyltransferase involved in cell wall biosynthesis
MERTNGPGLAILIPAFQPGETLPDLVNALLRLTNEAIVVVDDGSGPDFAPIFDRISADCRVHLVHHAVNLGKGNALKTGMNYALVHFQDLVGVVTADADGQHTPDDIVRVAEKLRAHPQALVMGARAFSGEVPWRSRLGNDLTRFFMRYLVGHNLIDTQSGLRGIPAPLIPHLLRIQCAGYEFELDMLIACKHQGFPIIEEPIRTVYLEGNRSSHFHPVFDSMRIYFLLFRFTIVSLLTAIIDNLAFIYAFGLTGGRAESQVAGRLVAMVFNYLGARSLVFQSRQRHAIVAPKYVAVVAINCALSYALISVLQSSFGIRTVPAKLLAEGCLFLINFFVQRDFVFTRRKPLHAATDWTTYYAKVPATARLTRRYTTRVLLDVMRRYVRPADSGSGVSIVEIGGANSCFLDSILTAISCQSYDVVDTNQYGLSLLANRAGGAGIVRLHNESVLGLSLDRPADLVFSVGLVEHFDPVRTREAVLAHLANVRPGGTTIITFPTPTLLYRMTRTVIESVGLWNFPDERPLAPREVIAALRERGEVLYEKTLWPLMLTQHLVVARKVSGI